MGWRTPPPEAARSGPEGHAWQRPIQVPPGSTKPVLITEIWDEGTWKRRAAEHQALVLKHSTAAYAAVTPVAAAPVQPPPTPGEDETPESLVSMDTFRQSADAEGDLIEWPPGSGRKRLRSQHKFEMWALDGPSPGVLRRACGFRSRHLEMLSTRAGRRRGSDGPGRGDPGS